MLAPSKLLPDIANRNSITGRDQEILAKAQKVLEFYADIENELGDNGIKAREFLRKFR